ncbi:olfactory receptor 5AP2-like [Pangshura tecta]
MEKRNHSEVTEFILSGLTDRPELQVPLFGVFLVIYGITLVGNGGMILLIRTDPRLHTPMYFFLSNLSFCDLCYSLIISPKMLLIFLAERNISYTACVVQLYLSIAFGDIECLLLAVMAYDRYVAISNPLHYTVTMSRQVCKQLVALVYTVGFVDSVIHTWLTFRLSFCSSNIIRHFFCDIPPLLALSCSDTRINEIVIFVFMSCMTVSIFVTFLLSYAYIIITVLRIRSAEGRRKAFSTCSFHLITGVLLFGTLFFMYLRPTSSYSMDTDKVASVFYMVVIPMLNPLIYSLRNTEVKDALRRTMNKLQEMEKGNNSEVTEFILLGLTDCPELQVPLFGVFLVIYGVTLVGNGGMILLIMIDPQLHTPIYFFLSNLSFCDLCLSSIISPKMLLNFLAERKSISYTACAVQMNLSVVFGDVECLLLALMAYDRYVAICNPLHYTVTMSRQLCKQLVVGAYAVGFVDSVIYTCFTFRLSFCSSNIINHFFCDIPPLLALSCSDTRINEIVMFTLACCIIVSSFVTVLLSYVYIISTILQIRSAEGWCKTFSTCSFHLTAVVLLFGTLLFMYLRPTSSYSMDTDKVASVFYTVVIPMLNPLIYSLRNTEVKDALRRAMNKLLTNS